MFRLMRWAGACSKFYDQVASSAVLYHVGEERRV
jgi:hypothetical protein